MGAFPAVEIPFGKIPGLKCTVEMGAIKL